MITFIGHYGMSLLMDVNRFAVPGETVEGLKLKTEPGGKGYNQAVSAARLGAEVSFITAVGGDDFGMSCDEDLKAEGIVSRNIITFPKKRTACAFVINSAEKQSEVYVYPGAIRDVTPSHIEQYAKVIRKSKLLVVQNEISAEALLAAVDIAYKAGVPIIYNPAPAREVPPEIYIKADCITPNETEAAILTDAAPDKELDVKTAVRALHELGASNVIITLGPKGAAVSAAGGKLTIIPALNMPVVSTTGAGDCFNAALAVHFSKYGDYLQSAGYAVAASGISVSRPGVIASLPYKSDLEEVYTC